MRGKSPIINPEAPCVIVWNSDVRKGKFYARNSFEILPRIRAFRPGQSEPRFFVEKRRSAAEWCCIGTFRPLQHLVFSQFPCKRAQNARVPRYRRRLHFFYCIHLLPLLVSHSRIKNPAQYLLKSTTESRSLHWTSPLKSGKWLFPTMLSYTSSLFSTRTL